MSGFGEYLGIKYRSILKIFEILDLKQKNAAQGQDPSLPSPLKYQVDLSIISVCEEQVFDLLSGAPSMSDSLLCWCVAVDYYNTHSFNLFLLIIH